MAEAGLRREIQDNSEGIGELRQALPIEIKNISKVAKLLQDRGAGRQVEEQPIHIGLEVNGPNQCGLGGFVGYRCGSIHEVPIGRTLCSAYFAQARLTQLQTATLESMMALVSYVGDGKS